MARPRRSSGRPRGSPRPSTARAAGLSTRAAAAAQASFTAVTRPSRSSTAIALEIDPWTARLRSCASRSLRLRPRPVDRAGEDAGRPAPAGRGSRAGTRGAGGRSPIARLPTISRSTSRGRVMCDFMPVLATNGLGARILGEVLGEALEDDPSPATRLLRVPGQGGRQLDAELRRPDPRPRVAVRGRVRRAVLRELVDAGAVHVERLDEPTERLADRCVEVLRRQALEARGQVREEALEAEPLAKLALDARGEVPPRSSMSQMSTYHHRCRKATTRGFRRWRRRASDHETTSSMAMR